MAISAAKEPAEKLSALIAEGRPVAVATIPSRQGATARTTGNEMVIELNEAALFNTWRQLQKNPAKVLRFQAGSTGTIGSRRKRDAISATLRQNGISRVPCLIGLPIGVATPEAIAVSIIAGSTAHGAGAII